MPLRQFQYVVNRILQGKPEGRRPLGRPRRGWVENIKMDLREIGWDGVDWIDVAEDRDQWAALVNTVLNLRVPCITVLSAGDRFNSSPPLTVFIRRTDGHHL
jgi:hypothetical protein